MSGGNGGSGADTQGALRRDDPVPKERTRRGRRRKPITQNARLLVALTAVGGLAMTLLFTVARELEPEWQNRSLHVFKETAAALVLVLIAALLFGRFRRCAKA